MVVVVVVVVEEEVDDGPTPAEAAPPQPKGVEYYGCVPDAESLKHFLENRLDSFATFLLPLALARDYL